MSLFSKRYGYNTASEVDITVREDAPESMRHFLVQFAYDYGFKPSKLRDLVCRVLRVRPDENNWSEFPNIDVEVKDLVDNCKWYWVYDIYERIFEIMEFNSYDYDYIEVESEVNDFLIENGIGWKVSEGKFVFRGPESFEAVIKAAQSNELECGHVTASRELHEALSRRPNPDNTGAVQHAMASLECVAREIIGAPKANLGQIMKEYKGLIPQPLDDAVIPIQLEDAGFNI
ncbi:AbiJ-NTD4 domain-containing protein [Vibrio cincinnatiensis]